MDHTKGKRNDLKLVNSFLIFNKSLVDDTTNFTL